ncbi:MAG TPA: hypothetical protein VM198_01925 [Longimicrobiales bacterium]|jgi:hypothetical protein|nr:hypothetical protein [Longimicrobiales bacterium]
MIGKKPVKVRLVFVDGGSFHDVDVELPAKALERHERLVDCLREDPDALARIHVDVARLCAAYRVDE